MIQMNPTMRAIALMAVLSLPAIAARADEPPAYTGPMIPLRLAMPIDPGAVEQIASRLKLAEPQRVLVSRFLDAYSADVLGLMKAKMPELTRLSQEAGTATMPRYQQAYADRMQELEEKQTRLRDEVARLDARFLTEVDALLSEEQKPLLERLKLLRARQRSHREFCDVLSARIDLTQLVGKLKLDDGVAEAVDPILAAYEAEVTPLMVRFDDEYRRMSAEFAQVCVDETAASALPLGERQKTALELEQRRRRCLGEQARLQAEIARINRAFVKTLGEAMSEPEGNRFVAEYKKKAYQDRVYPDALDPGPVIQELLKHRELTQGEAQAAAELEQEYRQQYSAVSASMEESFDHWREEFAGFMGSTQAYHDSYLPLMREWRLERWRLNARIVEQVADIVQAPPDTAAGRSIAAYRRKHENTVTKAEGDKYPGL